MLAQTGQTDAAIALRRDAIESYTRALTINPDYRRANYNRGLIYYTLEEWQPMYDDFNTVVQAEPENYGAYLNRGIAASRLGHTQEAAEDLRKAIALARERGASWYVEQAEAELARLGLD